MKTIVNKYFPSFYFLKYVLALTLSLTTLSSCNNDDDSDDEELVGDWNKISDFAGVARSGSVGFVIGNRAYLGIGYDGKNRLKDFWQFDPAKESWIKKADFPGAARSAAVGFTANGKGYIGTGYDGVNYLKDFWEYDPATDTWTKIADFPGTARYGALAFAINDKGYVGAGYDGNYLKDFWQYDPATKQWTEKVGLSGAKRLNAFAFTLNGKGYVGGGVNNGSYESDFLEYDPAAESWKRLRSLNETDREDEDYPYSRSSASTFTINGAAYVVCGNRGSYLSDVWEYNAVADTWTQKDAFEGSTREGAVGFAVGNHGYIGTGNNSGYRFDDLWRFDPATSDDEDSN